MPHKKIPMEHDKQIALVAHDNKKRDLVEWAKLNRDLLAHHQVFATGTTGKILEQELGFKIVKLKSGPLGGDQQIGAKIVEGKIDFLIFFWDPLEPQPVSYTHLPNRQTHKTLKAYLSNRCNGLQFPFARAGNSRIA